MTREDAKNLVCKTITDAQGIKGPEVPARLGDFWTVVAFGDLDLTVLLDELVAEGRIIEVEYVIPQMAERCKSFYLPGGSDVRVKGLL